jgi:predicted phosphodiesterase
MKRIGLLSDTHSHIDNSILKHLETCDEIWHAGDIGDVAVLDQLKAFKPTRAVYGNIDSKNDSTRMPLTSAFHLRTCRRMDDTYWWVPETVFPIRSEMKSEKTLPSYL